jgi:hypothetical protein
MKRYFFDLVSGERSEYDFRGRECCTLEAARQVAELIALDLEVMDEGCWTGWTINVRNASGQHIFSVPVPEPSPIAA